ncbi:CENP-B N-terminal DNA-binding domain [Popillia japonica]|uniref:CENP-B N-terminal DNA-binding domain n=1 Tax=Popillia japonica TaxID=7064 RepID=A0AAW1KKQ1_POPJA
MTTIKRKALSLQDKIKILQAYDEKSPTTNQTELAAELQLPVSTLRTILKNRETELAAELQLPVSTLRTILKNREEIKEKDRLGGVERKKQKVGKFDKRETVSEENVDAWMGRLPELLQNYEPRNIFNADEFGLFFKLMPDKSYVFKGETCHGGKASKEKLTVLMGRKSYVC